MSKKRNKDTFKKVKFTIPLKTNYYKFKRARFRLIFINVILLLLTFFALKNLSLLFILIFSLPTMIFLVFTAPGKIKMRNYYNVDSYEDDLKLFIKESNLYKSKMVKSKEGAKPFEKLEQYINIEYYETDFELYVLIDKSNVSYGNLNNIELLLQRKIQLDIKEITNEHGYIIVCFDKTPSAKRINTIDTSNTNLNQIYFNSKTSWDFIKIPHMLISGETGSGKTRLIQYLIKTTTELGADINIIDPKNSTDLMLLDNVFPGNVYHGQNQIAGALRKFNELMEKRNIEALDKSKELGRVVDMKYKPVFIFFDEFAVTRLYDKKIVNEINEYLTNLILLGRSANIHIVLGMQRPDADTLSGEIRDQFGIRATVGNMSPNGYKMMFPNLSSEAIKNINRPGVGTGYILTPNEQEPKYIEYPQVDDYISENFADILKKILNKKEN